jgi:hypothetical protein
MWKHSLYIENRENKVFMEIPPRLGPQVVGHRARRGHGQVSDGPIGDWDHIPFPIVSVLGSPSIVHNSVRVKHLRRWLCKNLQKLSTNWRHREDRAGVPGESSGDPMDACSSQNCRNCG